MSGPNNSNRPPMRIKLHENEALRAIVAAAKVRMILANQARARSKARGNHGGGDR